MANELLDEYTYNINDNNINNNINNNANHEISLEMSYKNKSEVNKDNNKLGV